MQKKLYRSVHDRRISGVCGGIAEYFEIDSIIVRLAFIALTLVYGGGLIVYILACLVIPEEDGFDARDSRYTNHEKKLYRSRDNRMIAGVCAGFAEYFGIDVSIVRLVTLFLGFALGGGLIAYLIAWVIIPERTEFY